MATPNNNKQPVKVNQTNSSQKNNTHNPMKIWAQSKVNPTKKTNNSSTNNSTSNSNSVWHTRPSSMPRQETSASTTPNSQPYPVQQQNNSSFPSLPQKSLTFANSNQNSWTTNRNNNSTVQEATMPTPPNSPSQLSAISANRTVNSYSTQNQNSTFNAEARAAWFKHCLGAVKMQNLKASAKLFCRCGWEKISQGGIEPKLLISTNPADIKKANQILRTISQTCLLQITSGQTSRQSQSLP